MLNYVLGSGDFKERDTAKMSVALEEEYRVFEHHRTELLAKGEHKFVLIKGNLIVDVFVSYEDALKEGLKRFGNVPFLIEQIQREEEVNFFYTHPLR